MTIIQNILAQRYASNAMKNIWSEEGKILLEREFWIAVLKAQKDLGLPIPQEAIDAYERVKSQINLESIQKRDRVLRHDVKARIEEFCDLAGFEVIHQGMTSRDLTDNVEQYQIKKAMELIRLKAIRSLEMLSDRVNTWKNLPLPARTHNVIAQLTTFGKRLAMFGQDLLCALEAFHELIERYPLRGLKGAVGTVLDQKTLFQNSPDKVSQIQEQLAKHLNFSKVLHNVGQVYPRSLDFEVISKLHQLGAGPSSFAKTLRLMAGHELASEGFQKGQVGSSAMPHKMNSRNCERLNGFHLILSGYVSMVAGLSGDQWNEGDVSCSVVRRVALPDAFFAIDGLFETFLTVLKELGVHEEVVKNEVNKYLPFLGTTTLLMKAIQQGSGREEAHEIIKKHATETIRHMRNVSSVKNDLLQRLSDDKDFPLQLEEMVSTLEDIETFLGEAPQQAHRFIETVQAWAEKFPEADQLEPEKLI